MTGKYDRVTLPDGPRKSSPFLLRGRWDWASYLIRTPSSDANIAQFDIRATLLKRWKIPHITIRQAVFLRTGIAKEGQPPGS